MAVSNPVSRAYRVGGPVSDLCRACKVVRDHTVMAIEGGRPVRVMCDYCRSQHNYRGGDTFAPPPAPSPKHGVALPQPRLAGAHADSSHHAAPAQAHPVVASPLTAHSSGTTPFSTHPGGSLPFGAATLHEGARPPLPSSPAPPDPPASHPAAPSPTLPHTTRTGVSPVTTSSSTEDLESLLRRVVREELGLTPTAPAPRWSGGTMVLRPGRAGVQEKALPIDALFHKVVMIRNRLRTLEQHLNAAEIPEDLKLRLQTYITGCYGSLTSFNVLFADEADQFRGNSGDE